MLIESKMDFTLTLIDQKTDFEVNPIFSDFIVFNHHLLLIDPSTLNVLDAFRNFCNSRLDCIFKTFCAT